MKNAPRLPTITQSELSTLYLRDGSLLQPVEAIGEVQSNKGADPHKDEDPHHYPDVLCNREATVESVLCCKVLPSHLHAICTLQRKTRHLVLKYRRVGIPAYRYTVVGAVFSPHYCVIQCL